MTKNSRDAEGLQSEPGDGWGPLVLSLAIQSMVAMALLAVPSIAPPVASSLGVPATAVGIFVAVSYLAAVLASLGAPAVVARYGSVRTSQLGLSLCAAGLALCATGSVGALILGAVLVGLGYGPVTPASSHLLARTTPQHRLSLVFSVKQTGVPLGGVLAGGLLPGLQLAFGWQWALATVAVACAACAAAAQIGRVRLDADRDPTRSMRIGNLAEPVRLVLSEPALRLLAGCSFVFALAQLSLGTYVVVFLTESLEYGLVAAGALLALSQAGGVIGRIGWGYASDRWFGARRMLAILATMMSAAALATACLTVNAPAALVVAVLFLFGISAVGWNGVYLAELPRQAPEGKAGIATGGTLAITFLGNVLGPVLFAAISSLVASHRGGFLALGVLLTISAVALWYTVRRSSSS